MSILDEARARAAARPEPKRIDYERMARVRPGQKRALTAAVKAYQKALEQSPPWDDDTEAVKEAREKVAKVCKAAVAEWNAIGAWPDDWSRWQVALNDVLRWNEHIDIGDL